MHPDCSISILWLSINFAFNSSDKHTFLISSNLAVVIGFRGTMTISHPDFMTGIKLVKISFILRFVRFLVTALPITLLTMIPICRSSSSLFTACKRIIGWAYDFPNRLTRLKSLEWVRRFSRLTRSPYTVPPRWKIIFLYLSAIRNKACTY